MDSVKEWTSLPMPELFASAFCRKDRKMVSAYSSIMSPRQPNQSRDSRNETEQLVYQNN